MPPSAPKPPAPKPPASKLPAPKPPVSKSPAELFTYILEGVPSELVAALDASSVQFERNGSRFLILGSSVPRSVRDHVIRFLPGDQMSLLRPWLNQNVLDALHDQYVQNSPVSPQKQQAALSRWCRARDRRVKAERALRAGLDAWKAKRKKLEAVADELRREETAASEDIVRTHGKGPVEIAGVTWDPNQTAGRSYLVPRRTRTTDGAGKKSEEGEELEEQEDGGGEGKDGGGERKDGKGKGKDGASDGSSPGERGSDRGSSRRRSA